jgi:hypothetical protein
LISALSASSAFLLFSHLTNRPATTEPLMRRALAIFRAGLREEHPNTLTVGQNLELLLAARKADDPT